MKCQTDGYRSSVARDLPLSDGPKRLVVVDRTGHRVQTRRMPTREVRSHRKVLFPRFVEAHHKSLQLLRSELCVVDALGDDSSPEAKMLWDALKKVQEDATLAPVGVRLDACAQFVERARNRLSRADEVLRKAQDERVRLE